jgi:hypothetical protein
MPPALAVSVTDCATLTAEAAAEKLARVAPAATVTVAGTLTDVLLLPSFTISPVLSAAAFKVTVQLSVPPPVIDPVAQLSVVRTGTPRPERETPFDAPSTELLVNVSCPADVPVALGLNCTLSVALWLGFSVIGNVAPVAEKPVPERVEAFTVTAAVPVDDKVSA